MGNHATLLDIAYYLAMVGKHATFKISYESYHSGNTVSVYYAPIELLAIDTDDEKILSRYISGIDVDEHVSLPNSEIDHIWLSSDHVSSRQYLTVMQYIILMDAMNINNDKIKFILDCGGVNLIHATIVPNTLPINLFEYTNCKVHHANIDHDDDGLTIYMNLCINEI